MRLQYLVVATLVASLLCGWQRAGAESAPDPVATVQSGLDGNCHQPKRKPPPPSPPSIAKPAPQAATVIQVCSPVVMADPRPNAVVTAPQVPVDCNTPACVADKKVPVATAPTAKASAPESIQSFKFKIRDLVEAEVTSDNRWLVAAIVLAFLAMWVAHTFFKRNVPKAKPIKWIVAVVAFGIVLAAAWFVYINIFAPGANDRVVERLYTLYQVEATAKGVAESNAALTQISQLKEALSQRDEKLAAQLDKLATASSDRSASWFMPFALGLVGALAAGLAWCLLGRRRGALSYFGVAPTSALPTKDEPLPLAAIYQLEDQLAQLQISVETMPSIIDSNRKIQLQDPNPFLSSLNAVRRQLEGGLGADVAGSNESPVGSIKYQLKEPTGSHEFRRVREALAELNQVMASRYEITVREWRGRALQALARTRRELIAVLEPVEPRRRAY